MNFDIGRDFHIYTTDSGKAYISGDYFIDNTGEGRPNSDYQELKFDEGVLPIKPFCSNNYRSNLVSIMLVKNKDKLELWSAGRSRAGLLGQGKAKTESSEFKPMNYDRENINFSQADFKYLFGYAVTDKGELYAWGENDYSQCGISSNESNIYEPTPIPFFKDYYVHDFSVGQRHAIVCASPKNDENLRKLFIVG